MQKLNLNHSLNKDKKVNFMINNLYTWWFSKHEHIEMKKIRNSHDDFNHSRAVVMEYSSSSCIRSKDGRKKKHMLKKYPN